MNKNNLKLDAEEQDILDSFNRGEWISKKDELDKYKKAAKNTYLKNRRINFEYVKRILEVFK